jgi:disulfide oxidoreductase YuzD
MYVSETSAINTPFSFICAHGMAEEKALVDSGATENFMDERMVRRLGIGQREMKTPRRVFNVDGTENKQGTLTHYCLLRVKVGRKEDLQKFFITSLGGDRAIFGYPWLRVFNPDIDWKAGQVLGPPIRVETALLQWARAQEINQIASVARQHEDWEDGDTIIAHIMPLPTHATQQWAIEANKNKQTERTLPERYSRHQHVFSEEAAKCFPPSRPDDMPVRLKPGAPATLNTKIYPLTRAEMEEWRMFVTKNKALKRIKDSESPWASPVFFIHKKDGSFRLVQDYRGVNSWTERDVYPMPRIDLILEQLNGKELFTTLDIQDGYNNIRIKSGDAWKLAFKGPDGHYEPEVMFFGMTNAPAVFQRAMDWIFARLKAKYPGCIFVYMDDILIATRNNEQLHEQIVHEVLEMLKQEDYYLKLPKCLFHQTSIDYLGIHIEGGRIKIDPTKINGLAEWREELQNVHEVRSTLGAFGYNRPFVPGYADIVHLLTLLTKKDTPFEWTLACTKAIRKLKAIISSNPVLLRPDHD